MEPVSNSSPSQTGRAIRSGFVGTTVEWYDFYTYGTLAALVFDGLFFPGLDPTTATLASLSTFAVGFTARPLGGIVMGHFGDRIGRKAMLVLSLLAMGVATFLVGLLPTYDSIGIAAPVILVTLRFVQGFALGGEWGGAATMVIEHSRVDRRGLNGSFVQIGAVFGGVLSFSVILLLESALSDEQFENWGWRLPFLLSAALVLVGMYIRLRVQESPVFEEMRDDAQISKVPALDAVRRHPGRLALVFFMHLANTTIAFINAVFLVSYATGTLEFSRSSVLVALIAVFALATIFGPLLGSLSDRIGRRPVYLAGTIGLVAIAFPYLLLVDTGNGFLLFVALLLGEIVNMLLYIPQAAYFMELFPANIRYSGTAISVQIATVVGGGLAPMIATVLMGWAGGAVWAVAFYLMATGLVATVATILAPETGRRSPIRRRVIDPADAG